MKVDLAPGWKTELDRGPDWLFVKLYGPHSDDADATGIAETLSQLMHQEMKGRLVLELDEIVDLPSDLIEELILLRAMVDQEGSVLRICGLCAEHETALQAHDFTVRFTHFRDRTDAVLGFYRPLQPR